MGFSWKAETHNFNPSIYMNAMGHDKEAYTLEFGGTTVGNIDPDDANYGFVDPSDNNTDYWSMTRLNHPETWMRPGLKLCKMAHLMFVLQFIFGE
jgi:hypothetical protein